jgi:S-adenosylmethionine:tRNA ribosyltransferase-isomerase
VSPFFYDYALPNDRIAVAPSPVRDQSRLLVYDRESRETVHATVAEIGHWLRPGDLLVLNSARVDPARVSWAKPSGSLEEIVFLRPLTGDDRTSNWEVIVSGRRLSLDTTYDLPGGFSFSIVSRREGGRAVITLPNSIGEVRTWLEIHGRPPLPPYIRRERLRRGLEEDSGEDVERYQTDFASSPGAVAAPTAGLHFSKEQLQRLGSAGIETAFLHLSVGWGTFEPLTAEHFETGRLHPEWVEIARDTVSKIARARRENRRIVAVGTTSVRALEWWALQGEPPELSGWCDLFLFPSWAPKIVSAMVTNFHLPRSSLLVLVAAFLGRSGEERLLQLYREAVEKEYRFYSYGDAMLIL